jgi:hypothetical protein
MNQQRARRFKSAKEREAVRGAARGQGLRRSGSGSSGSCRGGERVCSHRKPIGLQPRKTARALAVPPPHKKQHANRPQREAEMLARGEAIDPATHFDSNCITPGTPFMDRLGRHLRFFVSRAFGGEEGGDGRGFARDWRRPVARVRGTWQRDVARAATPPRARTASGLTPARERALRSAARWPRTRSGRSPT